AVGYVEIALRADDDVIGRAEVVGSRAAYVHFAQRQEELAFRRELADYVVAVVGGPDRARRADTQSVGYFEETFAEALEILSLVIEFQDWRLASVQYVDVASAYGNRGERADLCSRRPFDEARGCVVGGFEGAGGDKNDD